MELKGKVSVVMPVYNCAPYLAKAIESIQAQTYPHWELLICDDGSTDRSLVIAQGYAAKDPRIQVLENGVNKGNVVTYNRLFFAANGAYIAIQDADDWSDPQRLQLQLAVLQERNCGICLTNAINHHVDGRMEEKGPDQPAILDLSFDEMQVWPATMMFRRQVLETVPGYHSFFNGYPAFDWHFVFSVIDKFGGYLLNRFCYHVLLRHDSNHRILDLNDEKDARRLVANDLFLKLKQQRQERGADWLEEGKEDALHAYEKKLLHDKVFIAEKLRVLACTSIGYGDWLQARKVLKRAIRMNPFSLKNYQTLLFFLRQR